MKLYSAEPGANISIVTDAQLRNLLVELSKTGLITHILETGTYVGLGSTNFIAGIFAVQSPAPQMFVTIEANYFNWQKAKRNLKDFPFVVPLWGLSTSRQEALSFMSNDPALQNHYNFPDIFIDDIKDPFAFYSNEIRGHLGWGTRNPVKKLRQFLDRDRFYAGEDLLVHWLTRFRSYTPLIVLDSAGGVGYLEFNTVLKHMRGQPYFLLLDDIRHLKHFRSRRAIHNNDCFEVLGENPEAGWLLVKFEPLNPEERKTLPFSCACG